MTDLDQRRKHQLKRDYMVAQRIVREALEQTDCGLSLLRVMNPAVDQALRALDYWEKLAEEEKP